METASLLPVISAKSLPLLSAAQITAKILGETILAESEEKAKNFSVKVVRSYGAGACGWPACLACDTWA